MLVKAVAKMFTRHPQMSAIGTVFVTPILMLGAVSGVTAAVAFPLYCIFGLLS